MIEPPSREVLVFNAALRLPANERAGYLSETCLDAELHTRVAALLRAHVEAGAFLQEPLDRSVAGSAAPLSRESNGDTSQLEPPGERCGDYVGRYKLLQQIGEGGCGVVYMAEQEKPVRRRVALKVIKLGMDTRQVIARFEAERQALAMMDHPNIAQVFDAGATEAGRPYFVMELVRGVKITAFCDENKLSAQERLRLFIQICHAIQHAHQKGVIHRDIKPTNILVPVNDGVPVPKVIDFGIAKATQGKLTDQTLFTAFEQFIGTPAYMSPEQAVMTNVEVDTRSDIYSLGVLLYELLTGQTPFAQKDLLSSGLDEMRRTIRGKDPVRPSTRLKTMLARDLATVAKNRASHSPQLIHLVRGDLDWIVMKCLQKDRARRYESANGLAMDIERHLRHQPVLARRDTQAYRMAKFVRRHRAAVIFAGLIFVALVAGLTGTLTQARRATQHARLEETQRRRADEAARAAKQQRDFALRQLSRAEAINDLNSFLLSDAAPVGKPFTVGDLLARAERVIDRQTAEPDDNRVELLIAIGEQYQLQDHHAKARELLGKAYTLSRKLSEPSIRARAAAALAVPVALGGDCERGEALVQEALGELGNAPHFVLHRIHALQSGGRVARECGQEDLGLERVRQAQKLLDESGQSTPSLRLSLANSLAESYRMTGRNREALIQFAAAFQQLSALGREETDKAATLLNNWAVALEVMGQPFEAEKLYRRALEISRADGTNASVSPMFLNNLARSLSELYRFDEAADYAEQASEKAKAAGDENVLTMCRNVQTGIYRRVGDLKRASEALAEFEANTAKLLPPGHVTFAVVRLQKSLLALAQGDVQRALKEVNEAVAMVEKNPAVRDRLTILLLRRAEVHLAAKQFEAARADAERAVALNQEMLGTATLSSWSGLAYLTMARSFQAEGRRAEGCAAYASALKHLETGLGPEHPETVAAAQGIADCAK
jgi:eukaryotic-like serine/threonine-protein kinase